MSIPGDVLGRTFSRCKSDASCRWSIRNAWRRLVRGIENPSHVFAWAIVLLFCSSSILFFRPVLLFCFVLFYLFSSVLQLLNLVLFFSFVRQFCSFLVMFFCSCFSGDPSKRAWEIRFTYYRKTSTRISIIRDDGRQMSLPTRVRARQFTQGGPPRRRALGMFFVTCPEGRVWQGACAWKTKHLVERGAWVIGILHFQ